MPIVTPPPDALCDLVDRARGGDRDAFGELVEGSWHDLVALARGILTADLEAEDIVQESLIHAWGKLRSLRKPESFPSWMKRIVARRCISRLRRRQKETDLVDLPGQSADPGAPLDTARLLRSLAPRQRAVLYLTWIEGCTDREAGKILGIRPATVRVHRHRGLQQLRSTVKMHQVEKSDEQE